MFLHYYYRCLPNAIYWTISLLSKVYTHTHRYIHTNTRYIFLWYLIHIYGLQAFPTCKNNGMILIFWLALAASDRPRKLYPINNLQIYIYESKDINNLQNNIEAVTREALCQYRKQIKQSYGWIQTTNHKINLTFRTANWKNIKIENF